jgi:hypothetical protein
MFSSEQYRAKAAEYLELAAKTESPNEIREFGDLERSYTELANNEEWLEHNFDKMVHAPDKDRLEGDALPAEEDLGPPRGGVQGNGSRASQNSGLVSRCSLRPRPGRTKLRVDLQAWHRTRCNL